MDNHKARRRIGPFGKIRDFLRDDAGAVTVDWVVLTGMIVLLGMASAFAIGANIPGLADEVGAYIGEKEIRSE